MQEIWEPIKDYENLYEVSNLGNVKRKESYVNSKSSLNKIFTTKVNEKMLKGRNCKGYLIVSLCKNGTSKNFRINRLVAQAFIPNPNNYPCVNHIDGNKQNNYAENLEWVTYSENEKHAYQNKLKKPTWKGKCYLTHPSNKKVRQYDLNKNFIKQWNSIQEAQDTLKITNISAVCRKKQKSAGGYLWEYF